MKIARFTKCVLKWGYERDQETLDTLFDLLDFDGFGYIPPSSFDWLDEWKPPESAESSACRLRWG